MANLKADIRVFGDLNALSRAAASEFVKASQMAAAEQRRFLVALSGGATPTRLYELLAQPALWCADRLGGSRRVLGR